MSTTWTALEIAGKPVDVYEPPGKPRFGILHLHDLGQPTIRDRPAFTHWLAELRLACVCPLGQHFWWTDRLCPEFDARITPERYLVDYVVPFFRERWELAPRTLGVQGIGMGGQEALRLAFKRPDLFPAVAAIAAAIDYHELYGRGTPLDDMYNSKEQCRQDTAIMHIHPRHYPPHIFFCIDPTDVDWYRGNDRLHEKLQALGIAHEIDFTHSAGGHSWDYFDAMAEHSERFLSDGLEKESRRLL